MDRFDIALLPFFVWTLCWREQSGGSNILSDLPLAGKHGLRRRIDVLAVSPAP
jgi:hypothetical protein